MKDAQMKAIATWISRMTLIEVNTLAIDIMTKASDSGNMGIFFPMQVLEALTKGKN